MKQGQNQQWPASHGAAHCNACACKHRVHLNWLMQLGLASRQCTPSWAARTVCCRQHPIAAVLEPIAALLGRLCPRQSM